MFSEEQIQQLKESVSQLDKNQLMKALNDLNLGEVNDQQLLQMLSQMKNTDIMKKIDDMK